MKNLPRHKCSDVLVLSLGILVREVQKSFYFLDRASEVQVFENQIQALVTMHTQFMFKSRINEYEGKNNGTKQNGKKPTTNAEAQGLIGRYLMEKGLGKMQETH